MISSRTSQKKASPALRCVSGTVSHQSTEEGGGMRCGGDIGGDSVRTVGGADQRQQGAVRAGGGPDGAGEGLQSRVPGGQVQGEQVVAGVSQVVVIAV